MVPQIRASINAPSMMEKSPNTTIKLKEPIRVPTEVLTEVESKEVAEREIMKKKAQSS